MGILDSTLNIGDESQAENIQSEETAAEGSKDEAAPSYEDENAMSETNITESLWYRSLGVKNSSANMGERDERSDDNDEEGATSSSKQTHPNISLKIPAGFSLCVVIHRQDLEGQSNSHPSLR